MNAPSDSSAPAPNIHDPRPCSRCERGWTACWACGRTAGGVPCLYCDASEPHHGRMHPLRPRDARPDDGARLQPSHDGSRLVPCWCTKPRPGAAARGAEPRPGFMPCSACSGRGEFPGLDVPAILAAITAKRGPTKGQLLTSRPKVDPADRVGSSRAYFVWRIARFHGGRDITLPVIAYTDIAGDPFGAELEALAEAIARRAYGTDRAAAARWGSVLGFGPVDPPPGLPPTAYPGGPAKLG